MPVEKAKTTLDWLFRTVKLVDVFEVMLKQGYHGGPGPSPPAWVVHDAGLDALVYYDAYCGSLCAETGYTWLHRETHKTPWRVARKVARTAS